MGGLLHRLILYKKTVCDRKVLRTKTSKSMDFAQHLLHARPSPPAAPAGCRVVARIPVVVLTLPWWHGLKAFVPPLRECAATGRSRKGQNAK
jgi:hypothetical protein